MGERGKLAANGGPIRASALLDHHFSGLDDHLHRVTLLQPKLFGTGTSDHAFDLIVADLDDDVGHDGASFYAFHDAGKLISS